MRRAILTVLLLALASSCSSGGGSSSSSSSASTSGAALSPAAGPLLAGAARRDVTPAIGTPLGGFGGGDRRTLDQTTLAANLAVAFGTPPPPVTGTACTLFHPSTGKHDAISAKAIVLERGGERFAILGLDAIGVSRRARDAISAGVAARGLGIADDHLMVCATHTHSGPAAIADKLFWEIAAMDVLDAAVFDAYVDGCAQAVADAASKLAPAQIGWSVDAETTVQHNRRGQSVFDPDLTVLRIDRLDGTPVACAVNLAVHGICLGDSNLEFTADLMGFCERKIEATLGAGSLAVFWNGCEGDVSPNDFDWTGAQSIGETIAAHALAVRDAAGTTMTAAPPIAVAWDEFRFAEGPAIYLNQITGSVSGALTGGNGVSLTGLQSLFGNATIQLDERWLNPRIPLQAMRIGDLGLLAVPGEALTTTGLGMKAGARALGFKHAIVVGLANDHLGYIADPIEYDRGGYEAFMTLFGRSEAPEITAGLLAVAARVKP
jgi:hypothetical protein